MQANALRLAARNGSQSSMRLMAGPSSAGSRRLATTTANVVSSTSTSSSATPTKTHSIIPLSNVEAQWEIMSPEEKRLVYTQLEELQKKDWKSLSIDEKKAAYYVSFGPHGPRAPASKPGDNLKIFLSLAGILGFTGVLQYVIRLYSPPPPRSMNKEWQEATNELAKEQKMNPIKGITSEGYSGKGFVQND